MSTENSRKLLKGKREKAEFMGAPKYGKTPEEHRAYAYWYRHRDIEDYNRRKLEWANNNREKRRLQSKKCNLKKRYGLTVDKFEQMLSDCDRKCSICGIGYEERKDSAGKLISNLVVDHCHDTGKVRGIICRKCNIAIGHLKDDYEVIKKAADYIRYWDDRAFNLEDL